MKIDLHTHILPKLDDGSTSESMSMEMLDHLRRQQVDAVVLTPHYYSHQLSISDFVEKRRVSVERLLQVGAFEQNKLYIGAEVYLSDYLFNNRDLSPLYINGTRTMLVEFPYNKKIDDRMIDKVDRLISEYGITPVIAHVERYPSLIRSKKALDRLLSYGSVLQVNVSSFTTFGKRRLISLVKNGYIGALGTDAHNLTSRPAEYNEGYRVLEKAVPSGTLADIQSSMMTLLNTK